MTTTTEDVSDDVAMLDDQTPTEQVTYTFKTTDENKTEVAHPAVSKEVKQNILDYQTRHARWRSLGQFVNDALVFYIDGNASQYSVEEIEEKVERDYDHILPAAVTPTVFNEIENLVDHPHTNWDFKQEFYSCAIFAYDAAGFPVVERR